MKNYIAIIILGLLAAACSGNLASKKEELAGLKTEMIELKSSISTLETEISVLDTTQKLVNYTLVSTVLPMRNSFEHRIDVRGGIQSRSNIILSAEMGGKIQKIRVKEGQQVKKGQTLIVLNADVIRKNIAELKTGLELAQTLFERQDKLWKQQIGTEVQYLQAKNNKESLEGKLATVNAQLAMSIIKAPISGAIDDLPMNEGELASPGMPLARMINPDDVYIISEVSEAYIGKINKGDEVIIDFITYDKKSSSVVSSVSQVINPKNRTFTIEIEMPNVGFSAKPNQVVVVSMQDYKAESALTLSTNIIQKGRNGNFVYKSVKKDGKLIAEKVTVTLGKTFDGRTEILNGLAGNEDIISSGFRDVASGAIIKVKKG
jgi:membrane fusion protein (multidrug efflux system)